MANTSDIIATIRDDLVTQIESLTGHLIACRAEEHDRVSGRIQGLTKAKDLVDGAIKKFHLRDLADYEEAA